MSWTPPEEPQFSDGLDSDHSGVDTSQPSPRTQSSIVSKMGGSNTWVKVLALGLAVALIGVISVSLWLSRSNEPTEQEALEQTKSLDQVVAELSRFVERARGKRFHKPVKVELLDDKAFVARLLEDAEEDRADLEETEEILGVLDLLEPSGNLFDELNGYLSEVVLGFYDSETDELVVRGTETGPFVRLTLVHELTHALDDQLYDLDREELFDADDESGIGFSALGEGSAQTVESRYRRSLSPSERRQANEEEEAFAMSASELTAPEVIQVLIGFPYEVGEDLIAAITKSDGEKALEAAYGDPPNTTEQLLHPERYVKRDAPIKVVPPTADAEVIDQGAIGELILLLLLSGVLEDQEEAVVASQGWGGDWYVAWREGESTCLRADFIMDTPKDLDELSAALDKWAQNYDNAYIEASEESVELNICG